MYFNKPTLGSFFSDRPPVPVKDTPVPISGYETFEDLSLDVRRHRPYPTVSGTATHEEMLERALQPSLARPDDPFNRDPVVLATGLLPDGTTIGLNPSLMTTTLYLNPDPMDSPTLAGSQAGSILRDAGWGAESYG